MSANIVFPPAVSPAVLECAQEASAALHKDAVYVSYIAILEIQGYELSLGADLSLEQLKQLLEKELPHDSRIRAKAETAYEVLAIAEIAKMMTVEDCIALEKKLDFNTEVRELFNARMKEIHAARAKELLAGPDDFAIALEALSYTLWDSALHLDALKKLARSARSLDECFDYVRERSPERCKECFDEVFARALKLCTTRELFKRFDHILSHKKEHTWGKQSGHYSKLLREARARFNIGIIPRIMNFDEVMGLEYEMKGDGPMSKKGTRLMLARATELAGGMQQLEKLLSCSGWADYPKLKTEAVEKWEGFAQVEMENASGFQALADLFNNHLPYNGLAKTRCLKKLLEAPTTPEYMATFQSKHRNSEGIADLAKNRYAELVREAMRDARSPSQITKALQMCQYELPETMKEGIAKFAAFYHIPKAKAA